MINIECVIGADGIINASISKDLTINVEVISSGPQGKTGNSAYENWLKLGHVGTEEDFILSLKGDKGDKGNIGFQGLQGVQGIQGNNGDKGDRGVDGVITEISGQYAFQIVDGDLYVLYPDDAVAPNYSIDINGNLILTL